MIKLIHQILNFKIAFLLLGITTLTGTGYAQIDSNLLNINWEYRGSHASATYGLGTQPAGFDTMTFPFAVQNRLATTTFGDLDNDGDQDFIAGNQDGGMFYYKNIGTATTPQFGRTALPSLDTIRLGVGQTINQVRPELVDIDNDGDFDLFLGSRYPYNGLIGSKLDDVHFFENIGTATTPIFTYNRTKFPSLAFQQVAEFANIAAVDIDGDTDLDLVMMGSDSVGYFENIGTLTTPSFQRHYGVNNPFDQLAYTGMLISMPDFEDFDGDGDYDMYFGADDGTFKYYQNKGTATVPVFHDTNLYPLHGMDTVDIGQFCHLEFVDITGDGTKDLVATPFTPVYFMWWQGVSTGISVSLTATNITCNGSSNGTAKATVTGATFPITYAWSTTATTDSIGGLITGNYILTITDSIGGTAIDSIIITEPAVLVSATIVDANISCNGYSNGGATASAVGGTSPFTYSWSNSATTAGITGVVAGTYSTTITDQNGCTDSASITITEPLALVASTILDANDTGGATGAATGTAVGGSTPYTYTWSNSATTASIVGVIAGTYSTTVTDASGCTDSASVIINSGPSASISAQTNVSCNGGFTGDATASVTGGTSPFTYAWSNNATTASITGIAAGTYTVTITDANSNSATTSATITQPTSLTASSAVSTVIDCNGGTQGQVTASSTGGTTPYTFSWNTGGTAALETGLGNGTYSVTITDQNGCTDSTSVNLTQPAAFLSATVVDSNDLGNGGGASASATGGNTPYTYSWSNGATTASVVGLFAGTYTVTVTDAKSCSGSAPQSITITAGPIITMILDSNVQCNGYSNGGVTASVNGGTTPYTYAWSTSTGSAITTTGASLTGLIAGTYTVTVTDNNSLSSTASITVTEPSVPTTVTSVDTNVSCFAGSNGAATAGISQINTIYFEGFENYSGASTYSANTTLLGLSGTSFQTSTSQGRIRIPAGANYVRTGNFSVTLDAAVVTAPDPVNYLIKTWDLSAYTTSPLNIDFWMMDHGEELDANDRIWIRGSNTDSWIEVYNLVSPNLSNGVWHNITIPRIDTIISNASQTLTSTFEVRFGQQDNFPSSSITSSDGFTFDDISITTTTVSQNSYLWSNNDTTASVTGLIAGKYMVTVTNGNGCSAVDSVTIIEPTLLTSSTVVDSNATCNGITDGGGSASGNGGSSPYSYAWATSTSSATIATTSSNAGIANAKYFVTVTDTKGCAAIDSLEIIINDIVLPIVITQNINSYLDNTGNATIATTDVDNGSNDACGIQSMQLDIASFNCSNIGANTVYLIVTDVNGNVDSTTATVTVMDTLNPLVSIQNYTAYLDASGSVTIDSTNVDNGSTDNCSIQTIALSNSSFTCANIGANAVLVTVTDLNGNADTATATVTVSDTISPTVNTQNVTVYLDATGSASITTSDIDNSSTDNCSVQTLSLDSTQFDCSETGYNTVTLSITDANGNTSTNTATVTVLDTISPIVITQSHTAYLNPSGFALITTNDINNGSSDNCSIQSLTLSQVIFNCADTGLNTVVLQVTDLNGNINSANAAVTIMDTLLPTVTTQNATVYLDAAGQASIVVTDVDNGSMDNCSVQNMVLDITSFDCSNVGPNTVVLTVTDVNGNVGTATAVVTVMDTINPMVTTQDITVYLDATGMAVIVDSDIDNGSTDNCTIQSYSLDISSFNCNDLGTNTVILAATDVNGNVSSASAVVTVLDTINPVITCPAAFSDCGA